MSAQAFPPPRHQAIIDRFVAACRADERVVAAFLAGSYAKGAADTHSDLDLFLVAADEAYEAFTVGRAALLRQLGEPLFLEDFDRPDVVFLIFPDGAEVELNFLPESRLDRILTEPHWSLLDKKGLLAGVQPGGEVTPAGAGVETLRRQMMWFWHDLSHFITAVDRNQLWWALGQLEELRRIGVNLARLRHDFNDEEVGDDPYFKVDKTLPAEALAPLRATFAPPERAALLAAARVIIEFYREAAIPLAEEHGIRYPAELERLMRGRLARIEELPIGR